MPELPVHDICTKCHTCQMTKKTFQKYRHLPEKVAEADHWDVLCIDLIGPYTIERENKTKKPLTLWALTMIDPATGWFKMREIKTKSADTVANVLEQAWLTRYPSDRDDRILDKGWSLNEKEFLKFNHEGSLYYLTVAYTNDIRSWERI